MSDTIPNISFAAVGDFGDHEEKDKMTKTFKIIKDSRADFFLALGDLYYEHKKTEDWINIINKPETLKHLYGEVNDRKRKIYPIIGNHDYSDEDKENRTQIIEKFRGEEIFNIPPDEIDPDDEIDPEKVKGFYAFKKQNIFFVMMDTEDSFIGEDNDGEESSQLTQLDFVRNALDTASNDSSVKWKVVCLHSPSVTTMKDHHRPLEIVQKKYHRLFDDFKVDLILSGHNHNFFVTHPISHSNSPDGNKPEVIDDTGGPYTNVNGRIFATIGTGGRELRPFDDLDPGDDPHYANNDHVSEKIKEFGIMLIKLQNNGNELIGFFSGHNGPDVKLFELRKS